MKDPRDLKDLRGVWGIAVQTQAQKHAAQPFTPERLHHTSLTPNLSELTGCSSYTKADTKV